MRYFYHRRNDGEHTMMSSDGVVYILKAYSGWDYIPLQEQKELERVWNS